MTSDFNPYQAPSINFDAITSTRRLEPAGLGRRFGTVVVDNVGLMAIGGFVGAAIGLTLGEEGLQIFDGIGGYVFNFAVFGAYYVFFEALWARTPGKWLFGTTVVDLKGSRPTFGQVVGRTVCRFIPFDALSFFGTAGWHDSIPKTRVVRHSDLQYDLRPRTPGGAAPILPPSG